MLNKPAHDAAELQAKNEAPGPGRHIPMAPMRSIMPISMLCAKRSTWEIWS